jgi:hypothetical protein
VRTGGKEGGGNKKCASGSGVLKCLGLSRQCWDDLGSGWGRQTTVSLIDVAR